MRLTETRQRAFITGKIEGRATASVEYGKETSNKFIQSLIEKIGTRSNHKGKDPDRKSPERGRREIPKDNERWMLTTEMRAKVVEHNNPGYNPRRHSE